MKGITEIVLPEHGMRMLAFTLIPERIGQAIVLVESVGVEDFDREWVTWAIFADGETVNRFDHCEWGHYFDNAEDAWNDYVNRAINPRIVPLRRAKP
jgi:hypothetical protein